MRDIMLTGVVPPNLWRPLFLSVAWGRSEGDAPERVPMLRGLLDRELAIHDCREVELRRVVAMLGGALWYEGIETAALVVVDPVDRPVAGIGLVHAEDRCQELLAEALIGERQADHVNGCDEVLERLVC